MSVLPLLFGGMMNLWHDYLDVALDPAHILAELTFTLIFDGLVIALLLPLFKAAMINIKKSLHKELDEEHGIPTHD